MLDIIFDLDGTLWDSTKAVAESWEEYLKEEYDSNFSVSKETLQSLFGKLLSEIAAILFPNETEEKQKELIKGCCQREHEYLEREPAPTYDKVEETLDYLKQKGYRLFVVSNSQAGYIEVFIKGTGLGKYFEGHLCAGDTGKPKAYNISKVIEDYKLENPIYVGDTDGDHNACKEAKVPFVYAAYGFGQTENPNYTINKFEEIIALAESL